jgi:TetR/AcrR family transcriptional regulator, transcriptional repressor of bet genes
LNDRTTVDILLQLISKPGINMGRSATDKPVFSRKSAKLRREELIAAGIACLGKGGMSGFTIDQICRQAGASRGLINHHFNTKDELLTCIYADMTEHLVQDYADSDAESMLAGIIETSFDDHSFNRSNLRAWLAIWGQVSSNPALTELHKERYQRYKESIKFALSRVATSRALHFDVDSVARQLIALIDGLWLEYCLHSNSFALDAARSDCYRFLAAYGVLIDAAITPARKD